MTQDPALLIQSLARVAHDGAARAGRSLSGLMGQEIRIHVPDIRFGTKVDACAAVGGEEALVMGAYLTIQGDVAGHVMLLFPMQRALECVDLMCGQKIGTTTEPDEMAESAIGELGNIVGSAFINALADYANLILHPSTPSVVCDMAIALVESIYAEIMAGGGDVVMIETVFEDVSGKTAGLLIVSPGQDAMERIEKLAA